MSRLREIIDRCHLALGESEYSDDESLPEVIEIFVREHRQRINDLEREVARLREELAEAKRSCGTVDEWTDHKRERLKKP